MLLIKGNARNEPPIIRVCVLPTTPELLSTSSSNPTPTQSGVDCRALLDTGADGMSVTRSLAEAANLNYRGKMPASGLAGQNYHRSWTTFLGIYCDDIGPLPFILDEPYLAIEVSPYPAFDVIIGREALMVGDFTLKANGDFEWLIRN
ncbi:aspartyl protease family protein [Pelagerythrobacter aerophilus]|nr:aspartyl protease family protein [Pelagerythrobacter aerophilus]